MRQTSRTPVRTLGALVLVLMLAALAMAPAASAAPYGEIAHFGSKGTGKGQFTLFPFETDGLGVDPTDNSVYVVDLPSSNGELRIQKFSTNEKGEFKFVAQAKFKPKGSSGEEAATLEGVAIDPAMHRLYVLALNERSKEGQIDKFDEAASELFAFSTEQKGEELTPIGTEGGVIAGTTVLKPQANKPEESLLEPSGIAVEPIDATHDNVVLLGQVDRGEEAGGRRILRSAIWRVSSAGSLLTERRYLDAANVLEAAALSPVVLNDKLYVQGEEGIYEIPASGVPKPFTHSTGERVEWWEELGLWLTPSIQEPFFGAGMSVGPEGTFWTTASIKLAANKNNFFPGAISYDQTGQVLGWTGGQSPANGLEKCVLRITGTPLVAAGKEWKPGAGHVVFMLDDNFSFPRLIQFGPGGEGCPPAQAASPTAKVNGVPVEESQPIPIAATVELDSKLTQANALSVEWNFGDGGAPVTIAQPAQEEALVSHKFVSGGTHTVTVKIHTDNLASPTVEATSHVTIADEPPQPPSATTGGATPISPTAELVKGAVNPNGSDTTCLFEYGTTTSYGKTAPCKTQPGAGRSSVLVEAEPAGLAEKTSYHYRLVAENAEKQKGTGGDKEFTTTSVAPAPKVNTEPASGIGPTAATLNAKVNPEGSEVTECKLEYGTSEAYGSSVPCSPSPGSGTSDVPVSGAVAGLAANTAYHFRVRAKNANPTAALGSDATFKTTTEAEPPAPKVKTEAAAGVGQTVATLNGTVNPEGSEVTECKLEYGTSETYGSSVPCSPPPGSGVSDVPVSGPVSGLAPNTTYHFRVRAKNANATASFGSDATFKTSPEGEPPAPQVKTEAPGSIGSTAATLKAAVNAQGSTTECEFEYGTTTSYGTKATCMPTPTGSSFTAVSANVGLAPDTSYHYRVRAKNANATPAYGADMTFRTRPEGSPGSPGEEEPGLGEGTPAPTISTATTPPPGGAVKGKQEASPNATIAGSAVTVGSNGAFTLKVSCPAGAGKCTGSVVVKTAGAVAAGAHSSLAELVSSALRDVARTVEVAGQAASRKSIVTLSSGSFGVAAGQSKPVALRLSPKARKLLAKLHVVRTKVVITAHNPSGASHTSVASLVLKAKNKR